MTFWSVGLIATSVGTMLAILVAWIRRRRFRKLLREGRVIRVPDSDGVPDFVILPDALKPSDKPKWDVDHYPSRRDKGEPLAQRPPNVGGEGHPPYQGPNYLTPEDTADYLRPIPHYGMMSLREVAQGDLAWECEPGRVAPDGSIWLSAEHRASYGTVTVPLAEAPKAARFAWQIVEGTEAHGYVQVRRVFNPTQYQKD